MIDFFYKNNTKISIIFFIAFLIGGISKCLYDKRKLDYNKKISYCTVKKKSKYRSDYFVFKINGKKYSHLYTSQTLNYVNGEKFLIEYDSLNPKNFKVLFNSPIFFQNEDTASTTGFIYKIDNTKIDSKNHYFYYRYRVGSNEYRKLTSFNKEDSKDIKKNVGYKILYWKKNPQRSILLLDEFDINDVIVDKNVFNE